MDPPAESGRCLLNKQNTIDIMKPLLKSVIEAFEDEQDPAMGGDQPMDDMELSGDDTAMGDPSMGPMDGDAAEEEPPVVLMDEALAVRIFEYIQSNSEIDIHGLVSKLVDLGNSTDDVLTVDHYDEITGEGGDDMGDEFADPEAGGEDGLVDPQAQDGGDDFSDVDFDGVEEADELLQRTGQSMVNKHPRPGQTDLRNIPAGNYPGSQRRYSDEDRARHPGRVKSSIQRALGTHTRPNLPEDASYDFDEEGMLSVDDGSTDDLSSETDFPAVDTDMDTTADATALVGKFLTGEITKDELISGLQADIGADAGPMGNDEFDDADSEYELEPEDDQAEFPEMMGEAAPVPQADAQVDPVIAAAYNRGYQTGKAGGQAQQQNINTPAGAAYNSGFSDGKAGKPATPPSATNESRRRIRESVTTFASFLADVNKQDPVPDSVSKLFAKKKQQAAKQPADEDHFEVVQDAKTSAIKIVNK